MVEAGSINIIGSIDVSNVKQGLSEMSNSLNEMHESAVGSFGDLKRLGGMLGGVASSLGQVAIGLTGAALGIAALSPQVAPALAKMEVGFDRMTRILGDELRPAFEEMASVFTGFVEWLNSPNGRAVLEGLNTVLTATVEGLGKLGSSANDALTDIRELFDFLSGEEKTEVPDKVTVGGEEVDLTKGQKEMLEGAGTKFSIAERFSGLLSGFFESFPRGYLPAQVASIPANFIESYSKTGEDIISSGGVKGDDFGERLENLMSRFMKNWEDSTPDYQSKRNMQYR